MNNPYRTSVFCNIGTKFKVIWDPPHASLTSLDVYGASIQNRVGGTREGAY
jgi:hypothetical protein